MATNTPVAAPEAKTWFMSGVKSKVNTASQKVKNYVGTALVSATAFTGNLVTPAAVGTAALAATSENANAALVVLGDGLTHSTVSNPEHILWLDQTVLFQDLSGSAIYNTMMVARNPFAGIDTAADRITINLSEADIGTGGILTIAGRMRAGTIDSQAGLGGIWFANTQFQVQQEARFGQEGEPMTTVAALDSGKKTNNAFGSLNTSEAWSAFQDFSYDIAITEAGKYFLDNALIRENATGNANFQNITLSYTPVPEPSSTGMLVSGLVGASLLIRRRENKDAQNK